jgi:hypothetical protein
MLFKKNSEIIHNNISTVQTIIRNLLIFIFLKWSICEEDNYMTYDMVVD